MKKKLFLIGLLGCIASELLAGGWLQGKGNGFFKLNQSVIRGDRFYSGDGSIEDITTTGVYQTSIYGEYGIAKKFDLVLYAPFFTRLTLNDVRFSNGDFQEGDEYNGVGDIDLGLKYGLRQGKKLVMSASLLLGLPSGNPSGGNTELLQSGDGEFNQMLRLDIGYGISSAVYSNVGLAFNNRTNGFSEEFRYDFELGYNHKDKVVLAFKLLGNQSLNNGKPRSSGGNGIFSNNLEYLAFGPELSYFFKKNMGFTAAYRTASSGQFIIAAPSYELGLFLKVS